jgi:lipid-binding SYLF domain-containing protein
MVFTNREGIQPLLKGNLKLGADASATAGPVGRTAEAGTDVLLKSAIYSYSRSKGLFAGIALDGAVLGLDDDANKSVYGTTFTVAGTPQEN